MWGYVELGRDVELGQDMWGYVELGWDMTWS
jgi:hypothetical protein